MNQDFDKLYQLVKEKYKIQSIHVPERTKSSVYFEELPKEIAEIQEEVKPNNVIHLQDELADGLWDLLALIEALKQE
jgi:NTP pyrophosphatase (non-canonical NTP hydrolase)